MCDLTDCPEQPLENTTIWVSNVDLASGDITINLFNEEPVSGFQFNLVANGLSTVSYTHLTLPTKRIV